MFKILTQAASLTCRVHGVQVLNLGVQCTPLSPQFRRHCLKQSVWLVGSRIKSGSEFQAIGPATKRTPVLLSFALVLGLEVSSRTNFESLALKVKSLALALSKSPWPRQVGQPVNLIFQGTCDCLLYSFDSFVTVYCVNLCHC